MAKPRQRSIKSRASLAGHPLHPVMIHFPVAALMALVASDIGFLVSGDPFWLRASLWLAGVGAFGAAHTPPDYRLEPCHCRGGDAVAGVAELASALQ